MRQLWTGDAGDTVDVGLANGFASRDLRPGFKLAAPHCSPIACLHRPSFSTIEQPSAAVLHLLTILDRTGWVGSTFLI